MRILLLNQFYPPDVAPTGQYLHDLGRALAARGHRVKVLCSRRSYNGKDTFPAHEIMDGVEVVRLPATGFGRRGFIGKIADYTTFYGRLIASLLMERDQPDLILSLTTPPYVGILAKLAARRHRCRHAHWIMDLYPDVLFAHGMLPATGVPSAMLRRLARWQFKGAERLITLGPKMADRISAYCRGPVPEVSWIALWANSDLRPWPDGEANPLRAARGWVPEETVFLYSGNMGLGHRFAEFLEAARRLKDTPVRWAFAGDGKRRAEIETFARTNPSARIEFLAPVPYAQLQAHLGSADVHLASMDAAWQGTMVPSKLQGSFAVGRPVLYVGGRDCETALWIQESGGGWVVAENDVDGLLAAIQQAQDPAERRRRGRAALEFARERFCKASSCDQFIEWLEKPNTAPHAVNPGATALNPIHP